MASSNATSGVLWGGIGHRGPASRTRRWNSVLFPSSSPPLSLSPLSPLVYRSASRRLSSPRPDGFGLFVDQGWNVNLALERVWALMDMVSGLSPLSFLSSLSPSQTPSLPLLMSQRQWFSCQPCPETFFVYLFALLLWCLFILFSERCHISSFPLCVLAVIAPPGSRHISGLISRPVGWSPFSAMTG